MREELWVSVYVNSSQLIIGATYIPPNANFVEYSNHLDSLALMSTNYPNAVICVLGDYNLPGVSWLVDTDCDYLVPNNVFSAAEEIICDNFAYFGLFQYNNIANDNGTFLALTFCNNRLLVSNVEPILAIDKHHPPLCVNVCDIIVPDIQPEIDIFYLDYKNAPYDVIKSYLSSIDWSVLDNFVDINNSVEYFYSHIYYILDNFITIKCKNASKNFPSWINKSTRSLTVKKKIAHKKYKRSGLLSDYEQFCILRDKCKNATKNCKKQFLDQVEQNIITNSRAFWSYVKSKNTAQGYPKKCR
nr:PREDICTED: uncharacterized protein LOC103314572 [Tribolium castaneum]XP_015840373.1 PREDICTED: uncharacterized protein LOC103314572 [Tribolium castaneum]XP_015840374.1 PREDICTED: uncharacterized protein LOC103314572 [Tribolium castaneum]XP_015840375.1 PREDICTED: uncharacterized protein LOC103314572 [Tribolium castaneum]|eukprot:XP_008199192.1 PREDICTED: uncharacterized protein LOC103314572 [Tribolium castaneum]